MVSFIFLIIAGFIVLTGFRNNKRKPFKNYIVLVSLDGFRWDYSQLYCTPNINKLTSDGIKADRLTPSFPANTFPNHYTIATGLYPDHHGLINNSFMTPDLGLYYRMGERAAVEDTSFYGGEPIWTTAERQGARTASFYWVGSKAPVAGRHPINWKKYDDSVTYEARIDTVIRWLRYPKNKRPKLVTLYFDEPDATSHDFGPDSPQTRLVITLLNSIIGVLRFKLSSLPFARKINIILLSDHEMGKITPEKYINLREIIPVRMIASISDSNPVFLINPVEGKKESILMLISLERS